MKRLLQIYFNLRNESGARVSEIESSLERTQPVYPFGRVCDGIQLVALDIRDPHLTRPPAEIYDPRILPSPRVALSYSAHEGSRILPITAARELCTARSAP